MKVSVVICMRNESPAVLAHTLMFFREQRELHDFEMIIVDDASDAPVESRGEFTLIRNEERQGIARSRNIGAEVATGDVLLFTDAHVYFSDNWFESLEYCMSRDHILGAKTRILYDFSQFANREPMPDAHAEYYGWRYDKNPEMGVHPIRECKGDQPFRVPYVGGGFLALSRNLFRTLDGFDNSLIGAGGNGDAELAMLLYSNRGGHCYCDPRVTVFHYTAPQEQPGHFERCPIDHPRYEAQLLNVIEIVDRHFPFTIRQRMLKTIVRDYPYSAENYRDFVDLYDSLRRRLDLSRRSERVEASRSFSREYVYRAITE